VSVRDHIPARATTSLISSLALEHSPHINYIPPPVAGTVVFWGTFVWQAGCFWLRSNCLTPTRYAALRAQLPPASRVAAEPLVRRAGRRPCRELDSGPKHDLKFSDIALATVE